MVQIALPDILALDPGGTTGFHWDAPRDLHDYEPARGVLDNLDHHDELWKLLSVAYKAAVEGNKKLHIVLERFDFRKDDQERDKIDYIACEYIGVVKLFVQHFQPYERIIVLKLQGAAQTVGKKAFFGDNPLGNSRLKKLNLWSKSVHSRDATRHYLYHRTFTLKDDSIIHRLR